MTHKTRKAAVYPGAIVAVITLAWAMSLAQADHHVPSDCETARDRAKSKYGAVRYQFDSFNRCLSRGGMTWRNVGPSSTTNRLRSGIIFLPSGSRRISVAPKASLATLSRPDKSRLGMR